MIEELIRRVLNEVEKRELPLLTWGVTNGTFSESELQAIIRSTAPDEDVDELLDALLERGLLVGKGLAEERYRSRMAETVRLATTLRQWFHGRDWRTAPELVSDSRFLSAATRPDGFRAVKVSQRESGRSLDDSPPGCSSYDAWWKIRFRIPSTRHDPAG